GANHVFHFDRWWNPAVENQATDRAFRIGQRRRVQVHKLLCAGTFEETIDELIERKEALSQAITGTSEAWITEMSTSELRDLLTLRGEATGDTGQPEPARESAGAAEVTTGVTATARRQRT
ncbi:MAG TPA: DEAD/DEAH box helicase, partial [Chloroflexota bacterium]|nr:DEAD/DEAH box helicase [Chloroflexota bacterium]